MYDPYTVHGNYSEWGEWSDCTSYCGTGKRIRYLFIFVLVMVCICVFTNNFIINLLETYSNFFFFSLKIVNLSRKRTCTNPEPTGLGYNCTLYGPEEEQESCESMPCSSKTTSKSL